MERTPQKVAGRTYALTLLWLAMLVAGLGGMARYDSQAGARGLVPQRWLRGELSLDDQRPTGLLFVHPRCPCSVASVHEFANLIAEVDAVWHVVSFVPEGSDLRAARTWSAGRQQAAIDELAGVSQRFDPGGVLAERHGVRTSGHLLLFAPSGELLFEGGLTAARGHLGASAARARARDAARHGDPTEPSQAPVFGCSLLPDGTTTP